VGKVSDVHGGGATLDSSGPVIAHLDRVPPPPSPVCGAATKVGEWRANERDP